MKLKLYYIFSLSIYILFAGNCVVSARNNNPDDYKVSVKIGECKVDSGNFDTGNDGQLYLLKNDDFELRLKQNTSVSISKNPLALTDELEIKEGIVGLKVASDTLYIKTPYADMRLRNATVTIRVSEHLVRLCVLEGTAIFIKNSNFVPVNKGIEIAASKDKLSKTYKYLDDLHFVWYWKSPSEEPSLKE